MQAIVCPKYGSPDVLQITEVEQPSPEANEVLVRIHASSVNSWDWDLLRGRPYLFRIVAPRRPRQEILGADIAGIVEAVGSNVRRLQPGDAVFGDLSGSGWGGFAKYVCAAEDALALKPPELTFEQAAAVPQAGVLALQGLRKGGEVLAGQRVLINGAGGGVGTFAVQIATSLGAEVTGVDSAEKLDMVRSLGADHVIDYRQEDYTRNGQQYDLILDVVANRSVFDYRRALAPNGTFVIIGGATFRIFQIAALGSLVGRSSGKTLGLLVHKPNIPDLDALAELIVAGKVRPVIDREYSLEQVPDALRYFESGRVQGKVVITM